MGMRTVFPACKECNGGILALCKKECQNRLTNPEGGHIFRAQNSRFHNKPAKNQNIIVKEEIAG